MNQRLSWKTCLWACAAALSLGACDSKNSQDQSGGASSSAAQASAAQGEAIGPVIEASTPTVATPPAPSVAEQIHAYKASPGEAALDSLRPFLGKNPNEGTDYLRQGILAERMKKLLGDRYDAVLKNLETVGPLTKEGGRWSIVGNRQHQGGKEVAAVVIDPGRNGLRVWLLSNGQQTTYTDLGEGHVIPWTPDVKKVMANAPGGGAAK
ncbi:hypothetical protein [Diaphorobacter caeni]|uniref:hypothetical protein n=1 Tax=Diaphorobacter caeni TaxID=2784387 RepID=UPI00188ED904|nr:hypothetical protein [Diaphorobacter caeni]MBF5006608.1 hypothetical protein [Diaphorobacter caeni]